jgi:D-amino-acid oxidase
VQSYETMPPDYLWPGINQGHIFNSVMVNVPMYLAWLEAKALSLGAIEIRKALPSSGNLAETLQTAANAVATYLTSTGEEKILNIAAFVNATGISAREVVPDQDIYPIRGQTVTVAGEASQITTVNAYASESSTSGTPILYILPRPHSNTTILGGTKQAGNWTAEPDQATTDQILLRAKEWAPELLDKNGEFDVLSVQVGHRPARKGGVRVEMESVDGYVVCHSYGHAGAGYQNSVGSANKVVRLLGDWFEANRKV